MSFILSDCVKVLSLESLEVFEALLQASVASAGEVSLVEESLDRALLQLRRVLVQHAMRLCVLSADREYSCPDCGTDLTHWSTTDRAIVTCCGEGSFPSERYRCRVCQRSFYPWQMSQGLDEKNRFTLSARQLIATEAAAAPFEEAAERLGRQGIFVSASEVDSISREVALWRKQEQEVVRALECSGAAPVPVALHDWSSWSSCSAEDVVVMSVDGAKVRSTQTGPAGLEWFEVRSGLIGLSQADQPWKKKCLGGLLDPDRLFEMLRSQWRQSPLAHGSAVVPRSVFLADGAEWIWDRVRWHFPRCVQILDIYHAAEHVASAAKAAWGADSAHAMRWADNALRWLQEPQGPQTILRALTGVLRSRGNRAPQELITEVRYLWRHRHRMRYARWRAEGLPIGSGAMESTIKQLTTRRLRLAGMKWTREHADLMLHLRAAVLSNSLKLTVDRERKIRANRAQKFYKTTRLYATAA